MRPAAEFEAGGGVEVGGIGLGGTGDDVGTLVATAVAVADGVDEGSGAGLTLVVSVAAATVEIATPGSAASLLPEQEQRPIVVTKTRAKKTCLAACEEDIRLDLTGHGWSVSRLLTVTVSNRKDCSCGGQACATSRAAQTSPA